VRTTHHLATGYGLPITFFQPQRTQRDAEGKTNNSQRATNNSLPATGYWLRTTDYLFSTAEVAKGRKGGKSLWNRRFTQINAD